MVRARVCGCGCGCGYGCVCVCVARVRCARALRACVRACVCAWQPCEHAHDCARLCTWAGGRAGACMRDRLACVCEGCAARQVKCKVEFVNFDGRADAESLKQIIKRVQPRKIAVVRGTAASREVSTYIYIYIYVLTSYIYIY